MGMMVYSLLWVLQDVYIMSPMLTTAPKLLGPPVCKLEGLMLSTRAKPRNTLSSNLAHLSRTNFCIP